MRRVSGISGTWLLWLGVVCVTAWSPPSLALGLGPLELNSALGEPLAARITLTSVSSAEQASLRVRLGDARAYERFGLKYAAMLEAIDVDVDADASGHGRVVLELTSLQSIHAPLLELLVIVETDRGRMLRQYTAFLNPAGGGGGVNEQAVPADSRSRAPVRPGDTLWDLALRYKYADVSVDQMMVAIYQHNPAAFGDDISQLRGGSTLSIPAPSQVRSVDATQAHTQVARAEQQWLDRITRMTLGGTRSTDDDSGTHSGRLRLVVPQSFPVPGGATPDGPARTAGQLPPVADSRVGSGFGRLSPLAGQQAPSTPFDADQAPPPAAAGTTSAARTMPAADETGVVAMTFGQLTMAPTVFPATKPTPATDGHDAPASTAAAPAKPHMVADDAKPTTSPLHADARSGASMHTLLWIVTALFLLLAAVLWLLLRRRPPEVALLASLAASESTSESNSEAKS